MLCRCFIATSLFSLLSPSPVACAAAAYSAIAAPMRCHKDMAIAAAAIRWRAVDMRAAAADIAAMPRHAGARTARAMIYVTLLRDGVAQDECRRAA